MDTALPPGPILPLIDELTDALVTGRVSPVGSSADGEPWGYWSCSIDRRDGEYAISEWRIVWPVYQVERLERIRLEESLSDLLAYCDQHAISRPEEIQVFRSSHQTIRRVAGAVGCPPAAPGPRCQRCLHAPCAR